MKSILFNNVLVHTIIILAEDIDISAIKYLVGYPKINFFLDVNGRLSERC